MEDSQAFEERIGRIEGLLQKLEAAGDPAVRRSARQLAEALMELHGAALERMLEMVSDCGETGGALIGTFGSDPLISSLLVLYGLHPDDLETRVRRGLESIRAVLKREGVHWEGLHVDGNAVQVKIIGSHDGSHARLVEGMVREALLATAPDATEVQIASGQIGGKEIGGGGGAASMAGFVPLARLRGADGSPVVAAAAAEPLLKT